MAILLIIVIYMIISFGATGGDGFAWIMLCSFGVAFIGAYFIGKEERDRKAEELSRRFDEYAKSRGWEKKKK